MAVVNTQLGKFAGFAFVLDTCSFDCSGDSSRAAFVDNSSAVVVVVAYKGSIEDRLADLHNKPADLDGMRFAAAGFEARFDLDNSYYSQL